MKFYLLCVVMIGMPVFIWADLSSKAQADTIATAYIVVCLLGFALVSARAILRRRPIEEPRQPADRWAASVRRMTWEPKDVDNSRS